MIAYRLRAGSSAASSSPATLIVGNAGGAAKHSADKLFVAALGVTNSCSCAAYVSSWNCITNALAKYFAALASLWICCAIVSKIGSCCWIDECTFVGRELISASKAARSVVEISLSSTKMDSKCPSSIVFRSKSCINLSISNHEALSGYVSHSSTYVLSYGTLVASSMILNTPKN
jgi:hypothetical protein